MISRAERVVQELLLPDNMKKVKPKLRARTLDTTALRQVAGGRGTYCGNQLHCDNCGSTYDAYCPTAGSMDGGMTFMFAGYDFAANCPSCGAAS